MPDHSEERLIESEVTVATGPQSAVTKFVRAGGRSNPSPLPTPDQGVDAQSSQQATAGKT